MSELKRREFLTAGAAAAAMMTPMTFSQTKPRAAKPGQPVAISSGNGLPAVTRAVEMIRDGADPVDAIVAGVGIVEDDPKDMSVGYGGLPNERGEVELDASVMHGPSHKAGAVAALRNIKNPAAVALRVLRLTNHTLLVGDGALEFARGQGFAEENLLTDRAREAWLRWRAELNQHDDWLDEMQQVPNDVNPLRDHSDIPFTQGTIHCSAVDTKGDLAGVTSTSGLSYKIPGRVGDSPIIGAGNFTDNLVGSAGATGRGESVIKSCGAFQVVQHMANGIEPTEACLRVLKWIANHTRRGMLLNERGEPNFQVTLYALRKDGAYGSACMRGDRSFAIHDGTEARLERCTPLYE
jgi:N4-(beta-N-acetylglucosaminyl)-L-asparaginase